MFMKNLHRSKALDSYAAARLLLKQGFIYPSYVMLKEATRSTLAYINEDANDKEYSEKTKMRTLLDDTPAFLVPDVDMSVFELFVDMEKEGLSAILALPMEQLLAIKKALKKVMGLCLSADI